MRTLIKNLKAETGKSVTIKGWVDVRRDQGKMIFFDFRDRSGKVQGVVLPQSPAMEVAKDVRLEYAVEVVGNVNARPEKNVNANVQNGDIELEITALAILNPSEPMPIDVTADTAHVDEATRLTYRYLDLRTARMQKNVKARHAIQQLVRTHLSEKDFVEIETPLLSAPTPEGSRSYVVPSRLWKGTFYSLPQSPQQYKQLLMVGGLEQYFQFARCMRDEDTRGDRQPEFTQLDMELSFVTREDVMKLNEELLIKTVKTLYPQKRIQSTPFPRMTYAEVMEKYGSDKPDIREDKNDPDLLAFLWVTDFPAFEATGVDNVDGTGAWTFTHNPFTGVLDEHRADLLSKKNIEKLVSTQYDIVMNGYEIGGGGIRIHNPAEQRAVFEIMGYDSERIDRNFGHMLKALSYGAPPHGGIAWGFDRLVMLLENEPNIREVIPFAKTGEGKDLMMDAPADVSPKQLMELGISINPKYK